MSDLVAAVSAKMSGTPDELIVRSAQARAVAQGITVDEVLAAWAGGGAIASALPDGSADAAVPAPDAPSIAEESTAGPQPAVESEPIPAQLATAVVESQPVAPLEPPAPEPPVEPADIADRIRVSAKMGAAAGALFGLFGVAISAPLLLSRLATVGDPARPAIEVTSVAPVLAVAGVSAVFGAVIALLVRSGAAFVSPANTLRGKPSAAGIVGAIVGFILGAIGMGILGAVNEAGLAEGTVLLSIRSSIVGIVLGGAIFGAITGSVAQAMGQPEALADQEEASEIVRRRLSNAVFIPLMVALVIIVVVIPLGTVLVRYASFAPLIAILVSALILTFSSLMASRPNLRVTRGEALTAVAGVGVVVLLLALIAAQLGGEEHSEGEETEAVAPLVSSV